MAGSDRAGYDEKAYSDGTIDRRLAGMQASLTGFRKKYRVEPEMAMLEIEEILWFEKQVDKEKMSPENREKLALLREQAEKLLAEIRKAMK